MISRVERNYQADIANYSPYWKHAATVMEVASLATIVFLMVAPFFIHVPSWAIWPTLGGEILLGIPLYMKAVKVEEEHKSKLKYFSAKDLLLQSNNCLHIVSEDDLPSQDPRIRTDRNPVPRYPTNDYERVSKKYDLAESAGAKVAVARRFAKLEKDLTIKVEEGIGEDVAFNVDDLLIMEKKYYDFLCKEFKELGGKLEELSFEFQKSRSEVEKNGLTSIDKWNNYRFLNSGLENSIAITEQEIPAIVKEKIRKKIAFLHELINRNYLFKYREEINQIAKEIDGADLEKLKGLNGDLSLIRSNIISHNRLARAKPGAPLLEPFVWHDIRMLNIHQSMRSLDHQIVNKERAIHLLSMAMSIALIFMYVYLPESPWMNLTLNLCMLGTGFGMVYANKRLELFKKEIKVLKMEEYLLENPHALNHLPHDIGKLIKKSEYMPFECRRTIARLLIDQ